MNRGSEAGQDIFGMAAGVGKTYACSRPRTDGTGGVDKYRICRDARVARRRLLGARAVPVKNRHGE